MRRRALLGAVGPASAAEYLPGPFAVSQELVFEAKKARARLEAQTTLTTRAYKARDRGAVVPSLFPSNRLNP